MGFIVVLGGLVVDQRGGEDYSYGVCVSGENKLVVYTRREKGGYFWKGRPVRKDSAISSFLPFRETSTVFSYSSRRR